MLKKYTVPSYFLKYTFIAVLFFAMIVLYVLEFPYFTNTFDVKNLILIAALIGLILGWGIAFYYKKYANNSIEIFQVFSSCIIIAITLMPLFISLTNRLLAFSPLQQETVELFKIEPIIADRFGVIIGEKIEPDAYYIFFIRQNELQRIKTKQAVFIDKKKGDLIELPVLKGLWGYEVVLL